MANDLYSAMSGDRPSITAIISYLGDLYTNRKVFRRFHSNKTKLPVFRFTDNGHLLFAKSWVDGSMPREDVLVRAMRRVLQHPHTHEHCYLLGLTDSRQKNRWRTMSVKREANPDRVLTMNRAQLQELKQAYNAAGIALPEHRLKLAVVTDPNYIEPGIRRLLQRQLELSNMNTTAFKAHLPSSEEEKKIKCGFALLAEDPEYYYNAEFLARLGSSNADLRGNNLPSAIWHERSSAIIAGYQHQPDLSGKLKLVKYLDSDFDTAVVAEHKDDHASPSEPSQAQPLDFVKLGNARPFFSSANVPCVLGTEGEDLRLASLLEESRVSRLERQHDRMVIPEDPYPGAVDVFSTSAAASVAAPDIVEEGEMDLKHTDGEMGYDVEMDCDVEMVLRQYDQPPSQQEQEQRQDEEDLMAATSTYGMIQDSGDFDDLARQLL
jgi:hypothetical protein